MERGKIMRGACCPCVGRNIQGGGFLKIAMGQSGIGKKRTQVLLNPTGGGGGKKKVVPEGQRGRMKK